MGTAFSPLAEIPAGDLSVRETIDWESIENPANLILNSCEFISNFFHRFIFETFSRKISYFPV